MILRPERQMPDVTSIPQRPCRRWQPTSIIMLVVSLIVLIAIGSVSWWLFSPLFFHTVSSTANPFTNSPSAVDGKYLIHFDHLNVTNGPDLHVYLAPTANSTDAGQVKSEGVDLGLLSATEGSLNVAVPTGIGHNLTKYHSVVIVCKTFSVIFTTAPLTFS